MAKGRMKQSLTNSGSISTASNPFSGVFTSRNLGKSHLGGVIFGCRHSTINECLLKQLFGLPGPHFSYIRNIDPGLPLFLFNYSDRKLLGIFEAASSGRMNINRYGWTADGSESTPYPAQVQTRIRLQCQPLSEDQFKPVISDNYYNSHHFWFELDHAQTDKLISLLESLAVPTNSFWPQNIKKSFEPLNAPNWGIVLIADSSQELRDEAEKVEAWDSEAEHSDPSRQKFVTQIDSSLDRDNQSIEMQSETSGADEKDKSLALMKLKQLLIERESQVPLLSGNIEDTCIKKDMHSDDKSNTSGQMEKEKNEEILNSSIEDQSVVAKLIQEVQQLQAFQTDQAQRIFYLEQKLREAELEIYRLKSNSIICEPMSNATTSHVNTALVEELQLHLDESIFLIGGCNGETVLSSLDSYFPSRDTIKSLRPMKFARSYASVARLNGEIYVFGGGDGSEWYDTVESYCPENDCWTLRPSLNEKKGSLGGATLDNKIFAVGGGNRIECFSDVEMLDLDVGRWISTQSMLQKRFALAAVELNGVLYATGGYDGSDYLKSAERFDPREHSWTKIPSMNEKRACHSLVVLNDKLYAIGGYGGNSMISSVEIYEPRLEAWVTGEPMRACRGYSAAATFKDSIYVIGGVSIGDSDLVEYYKEGQGWQEIQSRVIGKRCNLSAIV